MNSVLPQNPGVCADAPFPRTPVSFPRWTHNPTIIKPFCFNPLRPRKFFFRERTIYPAFPPGFQNHLALFGRGPYNRPLKCLWEGVTRTTGHV